MYGDFSSLFFCTHSSYIHPFIHIRSVPPLICGCSPHPWIETCCCGTARAGLVSLGAVHYLNHSTDAAYIHTYIHTFPRCSIPVARMGDVGGALGGSIGNNLLGFVAGCVNPDGRSILGIGMHTYIHTLKYLRRCVLKY